MELVKLLIRRGANVTQVDYIGNSVLHNAAASHLYRLLFPVHVERTIKEG